MECESFSKDVGAWVRIEDPGPYSPALIVDDEVYTPQEWKDARRRGEEGGSEMRETQPKPGDLVTCKHRPGVVFRVMRVTLECTATGRRDGFYVGDLEAASDGPTQE